MIQRTHNDIKPIDERKNINIEIAKDLNCSNKKLTVVTNMIEIVLELNK